MVPMSVYFTFLLLAQIEFVFGADTKFREYYAYRIAVPNKRAGAFKEIGSTSLLDTMTECLRETLCAAFGFDPSLSVGRLYKSWLHGGMYRLKRNRCPQGESICHCKEDLDFCFVPYNTEKLRWNAAVQFCQDQGGDLISLDTDGKTNFVKETLGTSKRSHLWLGATRMGDEWRWVNGQTLQLTNQFWQRGQPDNVGGAANFLLLYSEAFGFDDVPDNENEKKYNSFLCEF